MSLVGVGGCGWVWVGGCGWVCGEMGFDTASTSVRITIDLAVRCCVSMFVVAFHDVAVSGLSSNYLGLMSDGG